VVIDSSALVAILSDEPERARFVEQIEADVTRLISAATLLEAGLVIEAQRGEAAGRELDLFIHRGECPSCRSMLSRWRLLAAPGADTGGAATGPG